MPSVSFVVPCYNEVARLQRSAFLDFAAAHPEIDLWMVNDGSKDGTWELLQELERQSSRKIRALNFPVNSGKAEVIRKAILHIAETEHPAYIGFIDADLSAPLEEILILMNQLAGHPYKIVAGARIKMVGRKIVRKASRHYFGRIFATYQDYLLQLGNYDTQCGLKVFQTDFAKSIFADPFSSSWFFDIELFLRAKRMLGDSGYEEMVAEVPLNEWQEIGGSKLKMSDFIKAPFEVLKIYRRYK
ncbi:glycosyltransferase [Rurimicrobium arvi]|uniref:Glycosyltransferase 2-like domain-containing protein n=1 Tax=Rurimicrobium arvi TaxID=2049916 RepID=A0ABP8MLY8_9BACT